MSGREPPLEDEGISDLEDRLAAQLREVGPQDLGVWVDERADVDAGPVGRLVEPAPDRRDHGTEPIGEGSDEREASTAEEAAAHTVVEP
jgi:hypothetical protein